MRFDHPIRRAAPRARIDRGDALYRNDGPVDGFFCERRGAFWALTPGAALIEAFAAWAWPRAGADGLCAALGGLTGGEADDLPLFLAGVKLLDARAPEGALDAYERRVRQRAAVCLREKSGGGRLGLCAACLKIARQGLTKQ